jgi:SAM-dependent methyltransferase
VPPEGFDLAAQRSTEVGNLQGILRKSSKRFKADRNPASSLTFDLPLSIRRLARHPFDLGGFGDRSLRAGEFLRCQASRCRPQVARAKRQCTPWRRRLAMSDWGCGYVTDTAYVHDYCRVQTPTILSLAALAKNVAAPGGRGEPLAYCDLGCGQGLTANIVAAANPRAQVFGADFNPAHVAGARALANAAGLENARFREASFEELLHDASLPEFDFICLHGVYSWISPENRKTIVAFIRRRLKSGGLVYISYDAMPGWAGMAPLRRLLVQRHAMSRGMSPENALEQALAFADQLKDVGARFHRMYPHVSPQLDHLKGLPRSYLAHELFTREWQAFSFSDVAAELADAKLTYVGSAYLTDHVDRVNFTEEQQAFLAGISDPLLAETTRDMIIGRQFRRDVFVKGSTCLRAPAARERWLQTRFALAAPAEEVALTFKTALGTLQLRPDVYQLVIEALDRGPMTLRELIERLPASKLDWVGLSDAVKVLVGRGELQPALPPEDEAERVASTRAFNAAVMARAKESAELSHLASPVTGGGIRVDQFTQMYLRAKQKGVADPVSLIAKLATTNGLGAARDDKKPSPEETLAALSARAARVEQRTVPLLQRLGIC